MDFPVFVFFVECHSTSGGTFVFLTRVRLLRSASLPYRVPLKEGTHFGSDFHLVGYHATVLTAVVVRGPVSLPAWPPSRVVGTARHVKRVRAGRWMNCSKRFRAG